MNNNDNPKTVGERLKYLRKNRGESQKNLGEAFGISQKSISNYERNVTSLPMDIQTKYAEHFNVSHDYIHSGIDNSSILTLLEKNLSLRYTTTNDSDVGDYPVLSINEAYYKYLISIANINHNKRIPEDARKLWINQVTQNFFEDNEKNAFSQKIELVPLPIKLLYSDLLIEVWKQYDFLRELNNQLENISSLKNK